MDTEEQEEALNDIATGVPALSTATVPWTGQPLTMNIPAGTTWIGPGYVPSRPLAVFGGAGSASALVIRNADGRTLLDVDSQGRLVKLDPAGVREELARLPGDDYDGDRLRKCMLLAVDALLRCDVDEWRLANV